MNPRVIFAHYVGNYVEQLNLKAKEERNKNVELYEIINKLGHELSIISLFIAHDRTYEDLKERISIVLGCCDSLNLTEEYKCTAEEVKNMFLYFQEKVDVIPDLEKIRQETRAKVKDANASTTRYNGYKGPRPNCS